MIKKQSITLALCLCIICSPMAVRAFSVLTHEAIVDASWEKYLKPLLVKRFGPLDSSQLKQCRAYAYGGAIISDLGYYPSGNHFFTDLTHYVRSGDFILALLNDAGDANEFAFALGALSHYYGDGIGHELSINRCVPIIYEKDKKKFGSEVTYEQDKTNHIRVEFSFDVLQTARGGYLSGNFHDFIGFLVATPLLKKAFKETYGMELEEVIPNPDKAVESFRWVVRNLIPEATKIAWSIKKKEIREVAPSMNEKGFVYRMHRSAYVREYGKNYDEPGFPTKVLSFIIRFLPKVGPLKPLKFKVPTAETEKIFIAALDTVTTQYRVAIERLGVADAVRLPDINYDTGNKTALCEYEMANDTYAELLHSLAEKNFATVNHSLKENILSFYSSFPSHPAPNSPCYDLAKQLEQLKEAAIVRGNIKAQ